MLVNLKSVLDIAEERGCAIPAFNVYNMETVMGVARAAKEAKSAIIFQVYSRLFENPEAEYLAPIVLKAIEMLPVPAAFHLDHGAHDMAVTRALRLGATGIMRDASALSFADNMTETKRVVDLCATVGVPVEGELGRVGSTKDAAMAEYTNVDEAAEYTKKTGVSALAILVGTAHGRYKRAPVLDIERIAQIKEATGVPLVLHGGSGVPDDQVRAAINAGIRKINFGTDLCYSFLDCVFETNRDLFAIDLFMKEPIERVKEYALSKIRLLGAQDSYV